MLRVRNLAFYVEQFDRNSLIKLKPPKKYSRDGTVTKEFENMVQNVFKNGTVLYFDDHDCREKGKNIFLNISDYIDEHRTDFSIMWISL